MSAWYVNDSVRVKFLFDFTDSYGIFHKVGDVIVCKKVKDSYVLSRGGYDYDKISDKVVKEI